MACGAATLTALRDGDVYERLETLAARLEAGLTDAIEAAGTAACVQRCGSMLTLFFTPGPVRNLTDAQTSRHGQVRRLLPRHAGPRRSICRAVSTRRCSSPRPTRRN